MKLSVWAKKNGISYLTAWRWAKTGKLPVPFYRTPSGAFFVEETVHKYVLLNRPKIPFVFENNSKWYLR